SQPTRVVEGRRESLSLAQNYQGPPQVTRRLERPAQGEPEIDGLRVRVARLRQMRESAERLLEGPHGLAERSTVVGPGASLLAAGHGLAPLLAPQGMVGQQFDLLGQPGLGRALRWPPRSGRAAPAAAPAGGCRRPPRGSMRV